MKKQSKSIILFTLLAFLSASCGGSGDGQVASGGIGGTGISQGTITGFGSIILNGVKFNTDGASFTVDDNPGAQNDLAVGMQVTVQVDATGNTATAVTFEAEVEGPIDGAIDTANNSLVVLGRTVVVDASTVIEDDATLPTTLALADLSPNDMLEVSGLTLPNGSIQATYIRKKLGGFAAGVTELEIKGSISSLTATSFIIGGLTIDYSGMTPTFTLVNGQLVEAKGTITSAGASMTATEIKKEDGVANPGTILEIEGIVGNFVSSSDFSIGGQAVRTSTATTFEGGAKDDIIANVRLEVEGTLTTNSVLEASKVKFRGNRIKIEADVEAPKGTSPNSLTLLGKTVIINGLTEMKDGLSFSTINPGDRLEIRGYLSEGVITATRVKSGSGVNVTLQAPVEAISDPDLTLLGNNVTTTGAVFRDVDGSTLTSAEFFAKVNAGTVVKVKGPLNGTTIGAREVEIED